MQSKEFAVTSFLLLQDEQEVMVSRNVVWPKFYSFFLIVVVLQPLEDCKLSR